VNTKSKIGYGACLIVTDSELSLDLLKESVKVKRFEQTSSTKLELQTLLWALNSIQTYEGNVIVYTDSQNIIGLSGRRKRLEQNNYRTKKDKLISNHELYQKFYRICDSLKCEFVKVKGHKASTEKDDIDRLFTIVDRASRNALRD
jgi:ribonuclease HI